MLIINLVAILLYNDPGSFLLVRTQHLQYITKVALDEKHPRFGRYNEINFTMTGELKMVLRERLSVPDCAVDKKYNTLMEQNAYTNAVV